MISAQIAELWMSRGIALAVLLQTVELYRLRAALRDEGVFSWPILAEEHGALPAPLRWLFAVVLPYRSFMLLLLLRALGALWLFRGNSGVALFALFSQVAIGVRFRGTFNGGSDYMSVLVLLSLSLSWLARGSALLVSASLVYAAVQTVLSYFVAGFAKLTQADWRRGVALSEFVAHSRLATSSRLRRWLAAPSFGRLAAWTVLVFECSFPLALTKPTLCVAYLLLGLSFHVLNAWVFGLNRFVFAWAAAYPALLYASGLRS